MMEVKFQHTKKPVQDLSEIYRRFRIARRQSIGADDVDRYLIRA